MIEQLHALWHVYPIPNVFRMDNGLQFRSGGNTKRSIGRFLKFLLNLNVTPLFGSPSKPWTNPHVEGHNRVFNEKVWRRNLFTSPEQIDQECERFNQESLELLHFKYAESIVNGNFRYLEKEERINTDTLGTVKGKKVYFIRFVESYEHAGGAHITVLNEIVLIPRARFLWQPHVYDLVMLDLRRYSPAEALEFYEQIRAADPRQRIVFLTGPPKYVSRTWPGEVAVDNVSRGQWGETVKWFLAAA